jgi:K+-transporting ATPase ATPase C chain
MNAIRMLIVLIAITGLVYPLVMTGVAQALFPAQAKGSMIVRDGKVVGSALIGQSFASPGYFHSRPSAAGKDGYDGVSSSGSNLGPTNQKLIDTVSDASKRIRDENKLDENGLVPADLVLASASGLDPHISPAAAYLQVERVAIARDRSVDQIKELIDNHVEGRQLGLLGEPRVNVLKLNLALDTL